MLLARHMHAAGKGLVNHVKSGSSHWISSVENHLSGTSIVPGSEAHIYLYMWIRSQGARWCRFITSHDTQPLVLL